MFKKKQYIHVLHNLLGCFLLGSTIIVQTGCDMIEYHPYDLNIEGETNINERNIQSIEASTAGKQSISFALISDTQRWYDETEDAVNAINGRNDIDFVIHCGDLSDFGMKMEFEEQRDRLNRLNVPYVCLLGNHDCLATGKEVFNTIFGNENFSFTAGDTHFICLNTNALEFDYSEAVPNLLFLEDELKHVPSQAKKTVVAMHAPPYSEQFNNNIAKVFQYYITQFPSLQFCVYGHVHSFNENEFFDDGIMYYSAPSINKRSYIYFSITPNGYDYELVNF